jgi:hypothetical protein
LEWKYPDQNIGLKIFGPKHWPENIQTEILEWKYPDRNIGVEILSTKFWPENIQTKILA